METRILTVVNGDNVDALIAEIGLPASARMVGPEDASRLAAMVESSRGVALVVLAGAFTAELATLAYRFGVPICLVEHGAGPLRLAVERAIETVQWLNATRAADRVRALVNLSVTDVVFYLAVEGERFRFVEINPAFTRATGLTEEQVVGQFVDAVIPEPSLSMVLRRYRRAITERRTVRWDEITDYPTGRKHGEVSVTPVVDGDGTCTGLVGTVADVTDVRRARELEAGEQRILEMVASGASLPASLTALVQLVEALAPPAIASILLLDPDGIHVRTAAAPGLPEAYTRALDGQAIGPASGSCGTAMWRREPVIVTDIRTDPLWASYQELAALADARACWSTPILASNGRVLGTFAVYYKAPRAPQALELELIARIAHVAGLTIERHDLDDQLRQLSAHVEAAREDERTGIAREIHDQLGQGLTVLKMDLAWISRRAQSADGLSRDALLAKLDELLAQADQIIGEVRRISAELRPGILDDLGLDAAVAWAAAEFERRTGIECVVGSGLQDTDEVSLEAISVEGTGEGPQRLPREVTTAVFRVFQEALTNIVRHAEAKRVDVRIEEHDGALELEVRDDGKGIPDTALADPRSLGLLGIRERARRLGGTATFTRGDAGGTVVTLRIPELTRTPIGRQSAKPRTIKCPARSAGR